jgi:hypothetical protein
VAKRRLNISLIVLDTVRLDAFDRLLNQNPALIKDLDFVRFENCIATNSWTLPSHASMFTGMSPTEHGCHETKSIKSLDIDRIMLRKRNFMSDLKMLGYSTYGISANPYIHPIYGFTDFDFYLQESYFTDIFGSVIEVADELKPRVSKYRNLYGNDVAKLSTAIIKEDPKLFIDLAVSATMLSPRAAAKKIKAKLIDGWPIEKGGSEILKKLGKMKLKQSFFLFVNFMEAHDPYIGVRGKDIDWSTSFIKGGVDSSVVKKWEQLYDKASIKALKYGFGLIRHLLDRYGDEQVIILTSDHGQSFNEHDYVGHGAALFDELIKVPLIVILPKRFKRDKIVKGYQSFVNFRDFIMAVAENDINALSKLTSKKACAEKFSIPANIMNAKNLDMKKVAKFDKYEKRTFG